MLIDIVEIDRAHRGPAQLWARGMTAGITKKAAAEGHEVIVTSATVTRELAVVSGAVVHDLSGAVIIAISVAAAARASDATLGSLSSCAATVAPSYSITSCRPNA
jgi:hypothetical protein